MSLQQWTRRQCSRPVAALWQLGLRHVRIIPWSSLQVAKDLEKVAITSTSYAGCPLAEITPSLRGLVLETVARRVFKGHYPNATIQDPLPGDQCNGWRRGLHNSEYDFRFDGRRVQCKSAQMCWCESPRRWQVRFFGIKLSLLDKLVLVLYSPSGLHLFTHDCRSGLSTSGVKTAHAGLELNVSGPTGVRDWKEAESFVLKKLQTFGEYVTHLNTSDELVVEVLQHRTQKASLKLQHKAFVAHPLRHLTPTARGLLYQRAVEEVDVLSHPYSEFVGSAASNSPCDWHRDCLRVECKHTRPLWSRGRWCCRFQNIQFDKFDVLYLALDSPYALDIFLFAGSRWIASTGLKEATCGKIIQVYGPANVISVSVAVDVITQKLLSTGSQHVASVVW